MDMPLLQTSSSDLPRKHLELPTEVWYMILDRADFYSILSLQRTCKSFAAYLDPKTERFRRLVVRAYFWTHEPWMEFLREAEQILLDCEVPCDGIDFDDYPISYHDPSFAVFKKWVGERLLDKMLSCSWENTLCRSEWETPDTHNLRACTSAAVLRMYSMRKRIWSFLEECGFDVSRSSQDESVSALLEEFDAIESQSH